MRRGKVSTAIASPRCGVGSRNCCRLPHCRAIMQRLVRRRERCCEANTSGSLIELNRPAWILNNLRKCGPSWRLPSDSELRSTKSYRGPQSPLGVLVPCCRKLSSYIDGDICPVCDRDFIELEHGSLAKHVQDKVGRLSASAERLLALGRSRSEQQVTVKRAGRRDRGALRPGSSMGSPWLLLVDMLRISTRLQWNWTS